MTNEIVRASDVNLDDLQRMAKMMVASGYFDAARDVTQGIAQMAIKIMAGREMGYGPFASVQGIHVIQGKPSIAANLMAAAVKAHPRYDYRVRKMSNDAVAIEFFENGQSLGLSEYTFAEAKDAGLTSKDIWKKFPRNMLFARALSNGVRWYCPDVFNGSAVYVPEELGADVDGEGNIIDMPSGRVDTTTGEIVEQPQHHQPAVNQLAVAEAEPVATEFVELPELAPEPDNPFHGDAPATNGKAHTERPGAISKAQLNTLHALGTALYGDQAGWDAKRPGLVSWASKKRTESSAELWQAEASELAAKLEGKLLTEYAEVAQAAGDNMVDVQALGGVELAKAMTALRKRITVEA